MIQFEKCLRELNELCLCCWFLFESLLEMFYKENGSFTLKQKKTLKKKVNNNIELPMKDDNANKFQARVDEFSSN